MLAALQCRGTPYFCSALTSPNPAFPSTIGPIMPTWMANKEPPFFFASAAHLSAVQPLFVITGMFQQVLKIPVPKHC